MEGREKGQKEQTEGTPRREPGVKQGGRIMIGSSLKLPTSFKKGVIEEDDHDKIRVLVRMLRGPFHLKIGPQSVLECLEFRPHFQDNGPDSNSPWPNWSDRSSYRQKLYIRSYIILYYGTIRVLVRMVPPEILHNV